MRRFVHTFTIDASALSREGLARMIAGSRFRLMAHFRNLSEFPANWGDNSGLILIELHANSSALLAQLPSFKLGHEHMRVIMLSEQFDPEEVLMAIDSGADGCLLKRQVSPESLLKSLDLVLQGETILPQSFIQLIRCRRDSQTELRLLGDDNRTSLQSLPPRSAVLASVPNAPQRLSDKEQLILQHLTRGASNKQIARDLHIAEATVKVHLKAILRKIGVRNRTQAAMWAVDTQTVVAGAINGQGDYVGARAIHMQRPTDALGEGD
jgi:two-component system nitrate/nitrite response regulator NarL